MAIMSLLFWVRLVISFASSFGPRAGDAPKIPSVPPSSLLKKKISGKKCGSGNERGGKKGDEEAEDLSGEFYDRFYGPPSVAGSPFIVRPRYPSNWNCHRAPCKYAANAFPACLGGDLLCWMPLFRGEILAWSGRTKLFLLFNWVKTWWPTDLWRNF